METLTTVESPPAAVPSIPKAETPVGVPLDVWSKPWTPIEECIRTELNTLDKRALYRAVVSTASNVGFKNMLAWAGRDGTLEAVVDRTLAIKNDPTFFPRLISVVRLTQGGATNHPRAGVAIMTRMAALQAILDIAEQMFPHAE